MKKRLSLFVFVLCVNIFMMGMIADAASEKLKAPVITLSNTAATGKIKISWKKVKGAEAYKVYRSTNEGKTWKLIKTTENLSVKNTSTVAGEKYYYKVKAIAAKSVNNSEYSKIKSKVCDLPRPVVTVSTVKSTGKIKLSWKSVDKAKSYKVYRSEDDGNTWKLIKTTTGKTLTNTSVSTGKTYQYRVKAISTRSSANSSYSLVKAIKCGYLKNEATTTQYVNKSWVSVYEFPDTNAKQISLPYMGTVKMGTDARTGSAGTWRRLYYKDKLYYVWIVKGDGKFTTKKSSFKYEGGTEYQQQVLDMAVDIAQNWKTAYRHGQSDGTKNEEGIYGFDCSGFVSYVHNEVMQKTVPTYRLTSIISKLYSTKSVYNSGFSGEFCAYDVDEKDMQPGDVLFFSLETSRDHCGIYLGNNEFVHASYYWEDDSVCIMPLKDIYKDKLVAVRRYLPEKVSVSNTKMSVISPCGMYKEKSSDSAVMRTLSKGDSLTLLYTDNGNWAQVKDANGRIGYVLLKNMKKK